MEKNNWLAIDRALLHGAWRYRRCMQRLFVISLWALPSLFGALLLIGTPVAAQPFVAEQITSYTQADGLPNGVSVYCTATDAQGQLWVGTGRGLFVFDGRTFKQLNGKRNFSGSEVLAILRDKNNNMWVGDGSGALFKFDGRDWERFEVRAEFYKRFLVEDSRGMIWFSGRNNTLYRHFNGRITGIEGIDTKRFGNQGEYLAFAETPGYYYVLYGNSTDGSALFRTEKNLIRFKEVQLNNINDASHLACADDGTIWLAGAGFLARSANAGSSFVRYPFSKNQQTDGIYNLWIDGSSVWVSGTRAITLFNGDGFDYYSRSKLLPLKGSYFQVNADTEGHRWVSSAYGLMRIDGRAPKLIMPPISDVVQHSTYSFRFSATDGLLGTPKNELHYHYRLLGEKAWKVAKGGLVSLAKLHDGRQYRVELQVVDKSGNASAGLVNFAVNIDKNVPLAQIKGIDNTVFPAGTNKVLSFWGRDNNTPAERLQYAYRLQKDDQIQLLDSQAYSAQRSLSLSSLSVGRYTLYLRAMDENGNQSLADILSFEIVPYRERRPRIKLKNFQYYFFDEQKGRPVLQIRPVVAGQPIRSNRISFNIEPESSEQTMLYSVWLAPLHKDWRSYQLDGYYAFDELENGEYELKVRAYTLDSVAAEPLDTSFSIMLQGYPEVRLSPTNKHEFVGSIVKICAEPEPQVQYSFHARGIPWTPFSPMECYDFSQLTIGSHNIWVVARNEQGISPSPKKWGVEYKSFDDFPVVWLTDSKPDSINVNHISFGFLGRDDSIVGDKTPQSELRYFYRLLPGIEAWTPVHANSVAFAGLKNLHYIFQVKVLDSKGYESLVEAEHSFVVYVEPFYLRPYFLWPSVSAVVLLLVGFTFYITRSGTKQAIYEQRYNPYIVGEAVHEKEMFFGRSAMVTDVIQSVRNNSVCMLGERRIGKTSLLEHIENSVVPPFFSFFCNLESVKEEHFFSRIVQHLVNKIRMELPSALKELTLFNKEKGLYDEIDFEGDMDQVLDYLRQNHAPDTVVIMCLDEIDATENFRPEVHQSLRNVFQTYKGSIRMVAAGVNIKQGDWNLPTSPWYNFFEFKFIEPLARQDATQLILKPVKGFYAYDKRAVEFILNKSDCKPFYVQRICKKCITRILDQERHRVSLNDVVHIYDKLIRIELNQEFETFLETLSWPLQKVVIRTIRGERVKLLKIMEQELKLNLYNYAHRVVISEDKYLRFSTLFEDWLILNYKNTERKVV